MKNCSIPSAEKFRAQATGIGQTRAASERTGAVRSSIVSADIPPGQRQHAVGYPPAPEVLAVAVSMPVQRNRLRR